MTKWWTFGGWDSDDDDDDDLWGSSTWSGSSTESSYHGRKRYSSSLGWSRNRLTDTTSYYSSGWGHYTSSYYYNSSSDSSKKAEKRNLILMSKAYKAVRDMIVILDFPFEVIIKLNNNTGGLVGKTKKTRTVCVPSDVMNHSDYSDDEKINILCGMGTHEASHLKYTEYRTYLQYTKTAAKGEKYFANLIEDVRVEDKLLSERPGYLDLIEDSIKFRYKKLESTMETHTTEELMMFLYNVVKFIRYPDKLDSEVIGKFESQFKEIRNILAEDHQFTKDSCILGKKLYDYLCRMFKEYKYDPNTIGDFIHLVSPDNDFEVRYGQDSGSGGLCSSEMADFLDGTGESKTYSDIISGVLELGEGDKTFFEKPTGDQTKYMQIKNRISKYIPGIKKLIQGTDKNYDFTIHGCREGALDTNKLAEAYQGVPQVYIKKGKVSTNKTTVCVLIDQSGSMSGEKESLARDAAVLLNESLKDLPGIDLYIYGHSADMRQLYDTMLYVYREGDKYKPTYALTSATAHGNNRDGVAIYEVAKRIRKHTTDDCIMFILSDGSPAANGYCGTVGLQDTKQKVREVEKMGFTVIQVSIDYIRYAKEMFTNVISLDYDLSNLPKRLSQVIKKAIVRSKQTTVS